jgi:glycosyltransferase involved in cell wall biosynthesis
MTDAKVMIAGMLRIKNEARWIGAVVSSILPLCDRIVILDDHSEDETVEICRSFGQRVTVLNSPFSGLDESRDKNYLLGHVVRLKSEWCLCIDGDEIMDSSSPERIRAELRNPTHASYSFRIAFLWNAPDVMRIDGVYGRFRRPSLFRIKPGASFRKTAYGGHLHCGNVPFELQAGSGLTGARLYHLGYMCRADRLKKYRWYNEVDPDNAQEDRYRHMVQGDIPEVATHLTLKHAGPLTLTRLD